MEYTKGIWKAILRPILAVVTEKDGEIEEVIADVNSIPEGVANTRLIVKAPAMHKALKRLIEEYHVRPGTEVSDVWIEALASLPEEK